MSRASELRRTTGFKLALFFATMFGSASLIFVGAVYLMASHFITGNPDERMRAEAGKFDHRTGRQTERALDQHSVDDATGRRPFGLFGADGRWLAGNMRHLPTPRPPLETFFETEVRAGGDDTFYRSILHRLPDGTFVAVSRNVEELHRFRHELLETTLAALGLMIALGAAGGVAVGAVSLRRLENVIRAIENVARGHLSGRLPSRGSDDDMDRLARVVNSMLDQIERLMSEVKGVCDSVAHDLRTPLTRLLAALERANRRSLSNEQRRAEIDGAVAEVQLMLRTFAALLRISEVEDGARRASFREVELRALVLDAIEYYEPAAEAKGISLEMECVVGPRRTTMQGDGDLLFEAIGNVLDNAIKFTPRGGRIGVAVLDGPTIVVTDTGCGIATGDRERVMLRFHRGSASTDVKGTGLGLPLVCAVARLHAMTFRFDDVPSGCRVVIGGGSPGQGPRIAAGTLKAGHAQRPPAAGKSPRDLAFTDNRATKINSI